MPYGLRTRKNNDKETTQTSEGSSSLSSSSNCTSPVTAISSANLKCPWASFGCVFVGKQIDLDSHLQENVVAHFKAVKDKLSDLNPIEKEQINLVENEDKGKKRASTAEENSETLLAISLKRESEKLSNAFQALQSQLTNKRIKLENLETENKKLKDQNVRTELESNNHRKRCTDLGIENATLKANLETVKLKNTVAELENTSLKSKVDRYEQRFKSRVVIDNLKYLSSRFETPTFSIYGLDWKLVIQPVDNYLSVFLGVPQGCQHYGWERKNVTFSIKLINPNNDKVSVNCSSSNPCTFNSTTNSLGWNTFISLSHLLEGGFIVNVKTTFEVGINLL
eukprot:TRINITY_DN3120_c0_g1_i1.p1 TRINITY_DN3120_c0_g1~~TRINITY_DN3120_c0_g1_i1.p1  ORF type:complete len:338 (+),score=62.73 TRINITY_DN3120_c0_g1_i1:191-1204(+)